jgi:hypothetical protein
VSASPLLGKVACWERWLWAAGTAEDYGFSLVHFIACLFSTIHGRYLFLGMYTTAFQNVEENS